MTQTIQLYAVMAGVLSFENDFFPTCKKCTDYNTDLGKALKIYHSITAKDFKEEDILTSEVYQKYISVIEIPLFLYELGMAFKYNEDGSKQTVKDKISYLNDVAIWQKGANHNLSNIKDHIFEFKRTKNHIYKIINLRLTYPPKENVNSMNEFLIPSFEDGSLGFTPN